MLTHLAQTSAFPGRGAMCGLLPRTAHESVLLSARAMTANPTDPKRRRVVGNGAGIVQRLGRRLTKPQMQVRLPLPASPCPFLNARLLTPRGVF
jgi:hypothetical protein